MRILTDNEIILISAGETLEDRMYTSGLVIGMSTMLGSALSVASVFPQIEIVLMAAYGGFVVGCFAGSALIYLENQVFNYFDR